MSAHRNGRPRGFTLVEMLVVVAIIAILSAILIPAGITALNFSKRASNGVEIADLISALERYKSENGGLYPPSFDEAQAQNPPTTYAAMFGTDLNNTGVGNGAYRNTVLYKYLVKAYPKANNHEIKYMFLNVADNLDQSSALTFWLTQTSSDPRYPFTGAARANGNVFPPPGGAYRSYYSLDEGRKVLGPVIQQFAVNPNLIIGPQQAYYYRPRNAGETFYIYIEARHYAFHTRVESQAGPPPTYNGLELDQSQANPPRVAAGAGPGPRAPEFSVRPFLKQAVVDVNPLNRNNYVNPESYQLFCAGLDGRFSFNHDWLRKYPSGEAGLRFDGSPMVFEEFADDRDNQTNFSEGNQISEVAPN